MICKIVAKWLNSIHILSHLILVVRGSYVNMVQEYAFLTTCAYFFFFCLFFSSFIMIIADTSILGTVTDTTSKITLRFNFHIQKL